jgi:hypothetical protein
MLSTRVKNYDASSPHSLDLIIPSTIINSKIFTDTDSTFSPLKMERKESKMTHGE